jgi:hypothetical protein
MIDYLKEFPVSESVLPPLLRDMLTSVVSLKSELKIEVTKRFSENLNNEHCQMIMVSIPENSLDSIGVMDAASSGVISYSIPDCENKGELADLRYIR